MSIRQLILVVCLISVSSTVNLDLSDCDAENVLKKYMTCISPLANFLLNPGKSSLCLNKYGDLAICVGDLNGQCGSSLTAKWMEYFYVPQQFLIAGNFTCSHLQQVRDANGCADKDPYNFATCVSKAAQVDDFCRKTNIIGNCLEYKLKYCPKIVKDVMTESFNLQRHPNCPAFGARVEAGVFTMLIGLVIYLVYAKNI